jgi:diaminohydroxyphosphoribosylaminopyrimidine deaminase/5-amino-6-(5-phosphoribosylamino)uracil reductase
MGVNSLLVEGGCEIFTSFIEQQLYDRISFFIAPKIIGSGRDAIGDLGIDQMNDSVHLKNIEMDTFENNFYITGRRSDVHGTY